jgi:hypothetical protein
MRKFWGQKVGREDETNDADENRKGHRKGVKGGEEGK